VSKIQNPASPVNQEARTQTDIRRSLSDRRDQVGYFARIVFQISILDDHNRTGACRKTGPESRGFAQIRLMPEQLYPFVPETIGVSQFWRAVVRGVVNDQDFVHIRKKLEDSSEDRFDGPFLVKCRYDEAQQMVVHRKME
jgi:hypothetical protein